MAEDNFIDLLREAAEMYMGRPKIEADIIYHVAQLGSEERAAVILAYDMIYKEYKEFKE